MNITLRKLALLEKSIQEQEESQKNGGCITSPINQNLKKNITELMDRVRAI